MRRRTAVLAALATLAGRRRQAAPPESYEAATACV